MAATAIVFVAERPTAGPISGMGRCVARAVAHLPAIAALIGFQVLGDALVAAGQLRFPGSLLGMLMLLAVLIATRGAGPRLTAVSLQLARLIGLMVLPAGAAIGAVAAALGSDLTGISVSLVVSTLIGIAVTGVTATLLSPGRVASPDAPQHRAEPTDRGSKTPRARWRHGPGRMAQPPIRREDVEPIFLKSEPHDPNCETPDRPHT